MDELRKGLLIDGIASTAAVDSQAERLNVEGADISILEAGGGRINDNHGKSFTHSLGRIIGAKKILKEDDIEDDRQRMYWDKVRKPFIYVKGELFDDCQHPNAQAAAAIMKHLNKNTCPLSVKMSVEGSVLARKDGGVLDRTKVHSVALTFTPANKETLAMPLSLEKSDAEPNWEVLLKSVVVQPSAPEFIERSDLSLVAITSRVVSLLHGIAELKKALSAGYGAGSPDGMVGGSALQLSSMDSQVSCAECGRRQMVTKNQVKCGHCGHPFSMLKVAQILLRKAD
jgi:hypothetical protein